MIFNRNDSTYLSRSAMLFCCFISWKERTEEHVNSFHYEQQPKQPQAKHGHWCQFTEAEYKFNCPTSKHAHFHPFLWFCHSASMLEIQSPGFMRQNNLATNIKCWIHYLQPWISLDSSVRAFLTTDTQTGSLCLQVTVESEHRSQTPT